MQGGQRRALRAVPTRSGSIGRETSRGHGDKSAFATLRLASIPSGHACAGKLTNELVCNQLPPGVRQELERLNPRAEKGRRKYHHQRFLTGKIGPPHLEKRVAVVTALMQVSPDWDSLKRNFNRNFWPYVPEQKDLFEELGPLPQHLKPDSEDSDLLRRRAYRPGEMTRPLTEAALSLFDLTLVP
jgi:hypothetical protein